MTDGSWFGESTSSGRDLRRIHQADPPPALRQQPRARGRHLRRAVRVRVAPRSARRGPQAARRHDASRARARRTARRRRAARIERDDLREQVAYWRNEAEATTDAAREAVFNKQRAAIRPLRASVGELQTELNESEGIRRTLAKRLKGAAE